MPDTAVRQSWRARTHRGLAAAVAGLAVAVAAPAAIVPAEAVASTKQSSATIKAVQRALGITADGVMGPQTRRAVKRFQRRRGLTVDGIIGPQTLKALGVKARGASRGVSAQLQKIAACESGGNPRAVSPGGTYRGKYQFSRATWRSLGGKGDPAKASEALQDRMARKLMRTQGPGAWPNCA